MTSYGFTRTPWVNSLWPRDSICRHCPVSTYASSNSFLSDSTKPLPESMLSYHQYNHLRTILQKLPQPPITKINFGNYLSQTSFKFPRGQWVMGEGGGVSKSVGVRHSKFKLDPTRSEYNDRFAQFGGQKDRLHTENGGQDLNKMVDMVKFWGAKRSSRCRGAKPRRIPTDSQRGSPPPPYSDMS